MKTGNLLRYKSLKYPRRTLRYTATKLKRSDFTKISYGMISHMFKTFGRIGVYNYSLWAKSQRSLFPERFKAFKEYK